MLNSLKRTLGACALAMTLVGLWPGEAAACPVCFGASDAPMAIAVNWGVMAMLIVTAGVLGAFATFFVYLVKRAKLAEEVSGTSAGAPGGTI